MTGYPAIAGAMGGPANASAAPVAGMAARQRISSAGTTSRTTARASTTGSDRNFGTAIEYSRQGYPGCHGTARTVSGFCVAKCANTSLLTRQRHRNSNAIICTRKLAN